MASFTYTGEQITSYTLIWVRSVHPQAPDSSSVRSVATEIVPGTGPTLPINTGSILSLITSSRMQPPPPSLSCHSLPRFSSS